MVTTSNNDSRMYVDGICNDQTFASSEGKTNEKQQTDPLRKYLRGLWIHIRLFFETNKWEHIISLKVGDSHYMMRMDEIESRWRNK